MELERVALTVLRIPPPAAAISYQIPVGASAKAVVTAGTLAFVATSAGQTIRGTLMCLSENEAWLLRDGRLSKLPLPDVRRIRTPADPVWDGAATGAVIPLIFWALLCHECPAEPLLKAALTFGMIGLAADALQSNRRTLYRGGGRSLSVGWGFSF